MKKYILALISFALIFTCSLVAGQEKTDVKKNKDFIKVYTADFWNAHNLDAFDMYYAPDFLVHFPDGDQSREQYKGICQAYFTAFPDLKVSTNYLVAEGDKVVKVWTVNCTSKGEFLGIPPTGKPLQITGMEMFRLEGGKIAELWVNMDNLGMLQQLGVIPVMGE